MLQQTSAFNTRPLYMQVADEFANRLIAGIWPPGATITNEGDLSRELGVSLGTVRKAFDILVDLSLLERHQGRGTIVPDFSSKRFRARFCNLRDASDTEVVGDIEVLGPVEVAQVPRLVADLLDVNERTPVLCFRRRRTHEGRPFMHERVYLRGNADLAEASEAELHLRASRGWFAHDLAASFHEDVSTIGADAQDAELLDAREGDPLLLLQRVVASYRRQPLEVRFARCALGADLHYCGNRRETPGLRGSM